MDLFKIIQVVYYLMGFISGCVMLLKEWKLYRNKRTSIKDKDIDEKQSIT